MKTGVCLQLGLFQTAEYLYLVDGTQEIGELKGMPDSISYDNWHYYGVDADPTSINLMLDQYGNNPDATWICARVISEAPVGTLLPITALVISDDIQSLVPCISFDMLVKGLELSHIDVLAIDIEGSEIDLLNNYTFEVKPTFIAVESHNEQHDVVKEILKKQGYRLLKEEDTNFHSGRWNTKELQFIL